LKKYDTVKKRYEAEAQKWGDSPSSTMDDEIIRSRETGLIVKFFDVCENRTLKVADIGCGNGHTLSLLARQFIHNTYWGIDNSPELLAIARNRQLAKCQFVEGNACRLNFENEFFDVIYTQRCLINILDWEEQRKALVEIRRTLKPEGLYLMVECFTDGLMNNNKARLECGLTELKEASHNKYLDKQTLAEAVSGRFTIMEPNQLDGRLPPYNFLSSHYFVARVLHPLVTKGEQIKNTEFVKFFSFLPPIGNYSPIQAHVLRKQ